MHAGRGFTLLEVLAALAIFAVAVVGLIEAVAMQTRAEQVAEDTTRSAMMARSIIEELQAKRDLEPREDSGKSGDLTWTYRIASEDQPGLVRISVTVTGSGRDYELETQMAER